MRFSAGFVWENKIYLISLLRYELSAECGNKRASVNLREV